MTRRREVLEQLESARRRREEAYRAHQRRYEAWTQHEEQLRGLVPKALEVLERALDDPEQGPKLALAVLKAAGLWGLKPVSQPEAWAYQLSAELEAELGGDGELAP